MAPAPDLSGPIDTVFETAQAYVLAQMPRAFRGYPVDKARIGLDQDRRLATFAWGGVSAVAGAQVVGVYMDALDSPGLVTWRWGWTDKLFQPGLLEHVATARAWGVRRQFEEFDLMELVGHRERFWGLAMICAALNGAVGVVGLPSNDAMVLLTVGPLRDS